MYSATWEEHLQHLRNILQRLKKAGLTAKPKKCQLGIERRMYLAIGYVVGSGKIQPEHSKIESLKRFEAPKTKKSSLHVSRHNWILSEVYSTLIDHCLPTN